MKQRSLYLDVSELPHHAFGSRSRMWWGTVAFMVIEGAMFAMLLGTYAYLYGVEATWPPAPWPPPDLLWGTVNTAILLASLVPNHILKKKTQARDLPGMRRWMPVDDLFGIAFLGVRGLELAHLNVRWDSNAYGSIVWFLIGAHTVHLLTDVVETLVLTALVFLRPDETRLVDVSEDCMYWSFVVLAWVPIYVVLYWIPRWL